VAREPNVFASSGIDRMFKLRRDVAWLEMLPEQTTIRVVPVWRSMNLVQYASPPQAVLPRLAECDPLLGQCRSVVLLGEFEGCAYIALEVEEERQVQDVGLPGEFMDLHKVGNQLEQWQGGLLAYARGMLHWHTQSQYCGVCGSLTSVAEAGHMRVCTNETCATPHFPRTDSAIIVLVTDGDRCLLGRKSNWEPRKFSTIAGFVEPGESLEDAVRREVLEETGVVVGEVYYHSSQPWPFPASIMVGFTAIAESHTIRVDKTELEEARWLTREELREGIKTGALLLPSDVSIAYRLVHDWLVHKTA
jgi:NAD+ diphosphatase